MWLFSKRCASKIWGGVSEVFLRNGRVKVKMLENLHRILDFIRLIQSGFLSVHVIVSRFCTLFRWMASQGSDVLSDKDIFTLKIYLFLMTILLLKYSIIYCLLAFGVLFILAPNLEYKGFLQRCEPLSKLR